MWGLTSSRKQANTIESIAPFVAKIKEKFPRAGAADIRKKLRLQYEIKAPKQVSISTRSSDDYYSTIIQLNRPLILSYLHETEPQQVEARRKKKFKRQRFYAAGVNHLWAFDQHDKFKRFGLYFHLCIEPYCGMLIWLMVWWSNSNPRLWSKQYINAARRVGGTFIFLF